jgi:hypothetical protein
MNADTPPSAREKRRVARGWAVSAIGFAVMLWGVLYLTTATIGGPIHEFKDRRTYNEVKKAAHEAFPGALVRGLAGWALAWYGGRMRARAGKDAADS